MSDEENIIDISITLLIYKFAALKARQIFGTVSNICLGGKLVKLIYVSCNKQGFYKVFLEMDKQ